MNGGKTGSDQTLINSRKSAKHGQIWASAADAKKHLTPCVLTAETRHSMEKMHFSRMDEGTDEDFKILQHVHEQNLRELPGRLFALLEDLKNDTAYNVTRYDHCLQAATRALLDGKDDEYVAIALLHDACERLGPFNHGEVIGSILKPFVSRDNLFMLT